MSFETIFLSLVVGAFASLGATLFIVSLWARQAPPQTKTSTVEAKRPDQTPRQDRAA